VVGRERLRTCTARALRLAMKNGKPLSGNY